MKAAPLLCLLLLVAAVAAWHPTFGAPYAEDDYLFLEAVSLPGAPPTASWLWSEGVMDHHYRPISDPLFFSLLFALFGDDTWGYHLVLISLHVLTACLTAWLGVRIGLGRLGAFLAALLYVTRDFSFPSLVWASGFSDIGSAAFALVSIALFYRAARDGGRAAHVLSVLFFVLAQLTKETALVVIALNLLVLHSLPRSTPGRRAFLARSLLMLWPYLAVGLPLAAVQIGLLRFESGYGQQLYRFGPNLHSLQLWPLYVFWSFAAPRGALGRPELMLPLAAVVYVSAGALALNLCRRGTASLHPAMFGVLWFSIAILPALMAPQRALTNYLALAALGPCLIAGAGLEGMLRSHRSASRVAGWAVAVFLLLLGPLLIGAKADGRLASGGWVDPERGRRVDGAVRALTGSALPRPAADGTVFLFGGADFDLVVLGNPRGQRFGPHSVLASAVRFGYRRSDLEVLALPGIADSGAEVFAAVHAAILRSPEKTHVLDVAAEPRDLTPPAVRTVKSGGDPRKLREALLPIDSLRVEAGGRR